MKCIKADKNANINLKYQTSLNKLIFTEPGYNQTSI